MTKRIITFFLAALLLLPLTACGSKPADGGQTSAPAADSFANPESTAPGTSAAPDTTGTPVAEDGKQRDDVTRLLCENIMPDEHAGEEPDKPLALLDIAKYSRYADKTHVRSGEWTVAWRYSSMPKFSEKTALRDIKYDLSGYEAFSLWYYADESAIGQTFIIYFLSENSATDGMDYYSTKVLVEKAGWSFVGKRLNELSVNRTPLGWDKVTELMLISTGWGQNNSKSTIIYLDSLVLHTNGNEISRKPKPEQLYDAAAFAIGGSRAIIDNTTIKISRSDDSSAVYERDGVYMLPLSVIGAYYDKNSDYNAAQGVLNMTLNGVSYKFTAASDSATVDGKSEKLGFTVEMKGDSLFVPHTYIQKLLGLGELYTDEMGLVLLSAKKDANTVSDDFETELSVLYDMLFTRPTGEEILADIKENLGGSGVHPRIMLREADFEKLSALYKSDERMKTLVAALELQYGMDSAQFKDAPVEWELTDGVRLLAISREAKNRMIPWALLYRLTGDERYAERTWEEINALCNFKDWHPEHFLDTSEICYPMAVTYDWLYDYLTPERRAAMESATLRMGITPGIDAFEGRRAMWGDNNWCGVCNGGLTAAALAFADVYPEECGKLLGYTVADAERGMYTYAPDGGYLESPGYWSYGTDYLHVMISSLDSACGTDYGLFNSPGFAASAYFTAMFETEIGSWGFHDSGSGVTDTNCLAWFARRSGDPEINTLRRRDLDKGIKKIHVYDVMWYDPENISETLTLDLDAYYKEVGCVTMRNTWDAGALFCGLHGGANGASHGDLDIGNFVLYAEGERFICELGSDNYNIPGYFHDMRYTYYRKRAEGQNTLVIGDVSSKVPDQIRVAESDFLRVESTEGGALAVVDMAPPYNQVTEGCRGLMMNRATSTVVVQDELTLTGTETVRWSAHTPGAITVADDGRTAVITRNGKRLFCGIVSDNPELRFVSGKPVSFDPAYVPVSGESPLNGISKLSVSFEAAGSCRFAIVFTVLEKEDAIPAIDTLYTLTDIADWKLD